MRKKIIIILILMIVSLSLISVFILFRNSRYNKALGIKSISEFEQFSDLKVENIEYMTLKKTPDYPEWAEINNKEKIAEMLTYLNGIELSYCGYDNGLIFSTFCVVSFILSDNSLIGLCISSDSQILYIQEGKDRFYYSVISSDVDNPFDEFYNQEKENYKLVSPW